MFSLRWWENWAAVALITHYVGEGLRVPRETWPRVEASLPQPVPSWAPKPSKAVCWKILFPASVGHPYLEILLPRGGRVGCRKPV